MPTWTVRMFAYLRDRHGDAVTVECAPSAGAVMQALGEAGVSADQCRLAVNLQFSTNDQPLSEGDELALIPPVSGG